MQEILLKLLFRYLPGIFVVIFEKLPDGSGVTLLRSISHTGQLQGVNGFAVPGSLKRFCFCHDTSLLLGLMIYCTERYYIENGRTIERKRLETVWSGIQSTGSRLCHVQNCRGAAYLNHGLTLTQYFKEGIDGWLF